MLTMSRTLGDPHQDAAVILAALCAARGTPTTAVAAVPTSRPGTMLSRATLVGTRQAE